jgi:hypothetical protein
MGTLKKTEFIKDAGPNKVANVVRSPAVRVASLADEEERYLKGMLFGPWGGGKTFTINHLLELGFKVLVLTTDIGGDGLNTVILDQKQKGNAHLLKNIRKVEVDDYDACVSFIKKPEAYMTDLYDWDPDWVFWDGFSGFQQVSISEHVGDQGSEKAEEKGQNTDLQFEMSQWGQVRNATIRAVSNFLDIHNKKTGRKWHKILTCQENIRTKPGKEGEGPVDTVSPLLQGAGGILMGAGFDFIWRVLSKTQGVGSKAVSKHVFETKPSHERWSKSRGFEFPEVMDADFGAAVTTMFQQLDIPLPEVSDAGA